MTKTKQNKTKQSKQIKKKTPDLTDQTILVVMYISLSFYLTQWQHIFRTINCTIWVRKLRVPVTWIHGRQKIPALICRSITYCMCYWNNFRCLKFSVSKQHAHKVSLLWYSLKCHCVYYYLRRSETVPTHFVSFSVFAPQVPLISPHPVRENSLKNRTHILLANGKKNTYKKVSR